MMLLRGGGIYALCALLGLLQLQGCATWVDVEKFEYPRPDPKEPGKVMPSTQQGFRYSLPEPYLLVKPKTDGTATYEWVFLPNRGNEYVVNVTSFLATHKLEVKTENGFLKSATFDGTANEVSSKLAGVIGDVNTAKKDAEVAAEKAAEKAVKDKATADETAFNTKLANAQKALAEAEAALAVANAEVAFYESPDGAGAKPEGKLAATLAKKKAQATVALMRDRLAQLIAGSGGAADKGTSRPPLAQAMGPMLFRLVQTSDSVTLEQVGIQGMFEIAGSPGKGGTPSTGSSATLNATRVAQVAGTTVVDFSATTAIEIKGDAPLTLNQGTQAFTNTKASYTQGTAAKHTATFAPALPAGEYMLIVEYGSEKSAELKFTVK